MRPVPLHQRRRAGGTVILDEPSMQMQAFILQAVHVNRGDLEFHVRALEDAVQVGGIGQAARGLHPGELLGFVVEADHGCSSREDHRKAPRPIFALELLLVQHAGGEFRALAKSQQTDPVAGPFVALHAPLDRVFELVRTCPRVDLRVRVQPPKPPPEGPPVRVHGMHADSFVAEERRVYEHESKAVLELVMVQKCPQLCFENR